MTDLNEKALRPCLFCGKAMMLRGALWPSEGDTDAVIHAEATDCPMYDFCDGTADGSIAEKWNRRATEAATPPDVAGQRCDDALISSISLLRALGGDDEVVRVAIEELEFVRSHQAATALRLSAGGGEKGQWKEIETNFRLKGQRTSPAYFPATGEVCEVSGPNCDDANGYTWMSMTVLWQNEKFVLYGLDGCWPNLHKREHVLFRPLPASPTVEAGHVE